MSENAKPRRTASLPYVALKPEHQNYFQQILAQARKEMAPRNFAERHLVDEMATAKWRGMRTVLMEKAVYDHQYAMHGKSFECHPDRVPEGYYQTVYHAASAHADATHSVLLAALQRLDAQFHRQFCSALRHFLALRRMNPFTSQFHPDQPAEPRTSKNRKENPTCNPSL